MYNYTGDKSYSFSPFKGAKFLKDYLKQRRNAIDIIERKYTIKNIDIPIKDRLLVDNELKRFEVSRKYNNLYDLSFQCLHYYKKSGNFKYLNCSLKINDILVSNIDMVENPSLFHVIISNELCCFEKLLESEGITL